jgi:hypothetical protein
MMIFDEIINTTKMVGIIHLKILDMYIYYLGHQWSELTTIIKVDRC